MVVSGNTSLGGFSGPNDVVTTLAGRANFGSADGTGSAASFKLPRGAAVGPDGNIYVADTENSIIRKVTPSGVVTTLAGSGLRGNGDGTGAAASFRGPNGICIDADGNIYVADTDNNRIRKVTQEGVVTTLAGSGALGFADGSNTGALFAGPFGVTIGLDGNIYVADTGNNRIRKVTPEGVVTTVAGSGSGGFSDALLGPSSAASFNSPKAVAVGIDGNIYVADTFNSRIRKVTPQGVVTTLAGQATIGSADGIGAVASFNLPNHISAAKDGNIYVADTGNNRIRKVTPQGVVTTLVGNLAGYADGTGSAALFSGPSAVAIDPDGNIYIADTGNNRIRKIDSGLTSVNIKGNVYVANHIAISTLSAYSMVVKGDIQTTSGMFRGDGSGLTNIPYLAPSASFSNLTVTSNLYVPFIYNSSLQTSSIMASTIIASSITASTVATSTLSAYTIFVGNASFSNLIVSPNLYVPFIYNSSLQTSSIMASTIIASSITASTVATSTLSAYSMVVKGDIQTISGKFIGDGSALTNLPNSGNSVSFNNLYAPFIYNTSLQTSNVMASTIIASSITASTVATSTLWAYSMLVRGNTTLGGVPAANNAVITFAGSGTATSVDNTGTAASFNGPKGVAIARDGNIYVAEFLNNRIRKVTPEGVVTTLAGSGTQGSTDASGSAASFSGPSGVAVTREGIIYVADTLNNRIRKVTPAGVVTTLAGSGVQGSTNGSGSAASFSGPTGLAIGPDGNIYVADTNNNRIRKVTPDGIVTTLAGSGTGAFADAPLGPGSSASFNGPKGIVIDSDGNIYVADTFNARIRKVTSSGLVTTLAGSGAATWVDNTGSAASFSSPSGLAIDLDGNIYVADTTNHRIRKVTPAGVVTTLAGSGTGGFVNGVGLAASFNGPEGIAIARDGSIYIGDSGNNRIRKIDSGVSSINITGIVNTVGNVNVNGDLDVSGNTELRGEVNTYGTLTAKSDTTFGGVPGLNNVVTTLAGSGTASFANGIGLEATFNLPSGVGVGPDGTIYVGDNGNNRIRKVTPQGVVTTLAGSGTQGSVDGNGSAASFNRPIGVAVGRDGNIYVADYNNNRIRKVTPEGVVTTLAGSGSLAFADGSGSAASFNSPSSVVIGQDGNIYVADTGNNRIRKVTPQGVVTTVAGQASAGYADGTGSAASFMSPSGIAVGPDGNIYVADTFNQRIRKVTTAGAVTTLAGDGYVSNGIGRWVDGTGTGASFWYPKGIAIDPDGNIYVADTGNNRIRKVTPQGVVTTLAGQTSVGSADGTGSAASFFNPIDVGVGPDGNIYVADNGNNKIRKIDSGSSSLNMTGNAYFTNFITAGGSVNVDGNLDVGGNTNLRGFLNIKNDYEASKFSPILGTGTGQAITPGIKVGSLHIGAYYQNNSPVIWSESSLIIQASNGSVGMPRNNLDVGGNLGVSGTVNMPGLVTLGSTTLAALTCTGTSIFSGGASLTVTGGLTVSGTTNFATGTWHLSSDAKNRVYYVQNGHTHFGSPNGCYSFRNSGSSTDIISIDNAGNFTAQGDVTAYSDARVKTNIIEIDSPLEKIMKMRGIYYNRTDDSNSTPSRHVGVIAQEVETVLPEVVLTDTSEEKHKSVAYGNIVALLIEGMKAQQSTIEGMQIMLSSRT